MTSWLTNWLIEELGLSRHSNTWGTQCTQGTRALEGHLGTCVLEHSRDLSTWAYEALGHSKGTSTLGHSGNRKALGHLGTQALGRLGTRGTRGTLFSGLALSGLKYITMFNTIKILEVYYSHDKKFRKPRKLFKSSFKN